MRCLVFGLHSKTFLPRRPLILRAIWNTAPRPRLLQNCSLTDFKLSWDLVFLAISRDQIGLRFGLTPVKDDRVVAATGASDFQLNERAIVDKKKLRGVSGSSTVEWASQVRFSRSVT